ncbi:MAG: molybdenum ABC transporter ATP-binding protein [Alphaproteobacteria bacterium]
MPDSRLDIDITLERSDFDLAVRETFALEGVTALFGPSGGGKSTLLRAIAGFERPSGSISFDGTVWQNGRRKAFTPPNRRPVGFMFQDARLFAHLTVQGNLDYAAKRSGGTTMAPVVEALDLGPLLSRRPTSLSGGERQRVALGRTLLRQPKLLLLDEPLAALDADRKADILPYIETVLTDFGIPALYVSHSVDEVARLCTNTLVMAGGRIQAQGSTAEIMERLDLEPLTGAYEGGVIVEATVTGEDIAYQLTHLSLSGHALTVPSAVALQPGETVRLRVRARDVSLAIAAPDGLSIRNALEGRVSAIESHPDSAFADVLIDLGEAHLRSRVTRKAIDDLGLQEERTVFALVKSASFDRTER